MTPELPELPHDISDPQPYLPGIHLPWWVWTLIAFVIIGFLWMLVHLIKKQAAKVTHEDPKYFEEAKQELEEARKTIPDHPLSVTATAASLAIRSYLAKALGEPALYQTHEELLMRKSAMQNLPASAKDRLLPLLSSLAECKYGRSSSDETRATKLIDDCLETLEGIDSTRRRPVV